MVRILVGTLVDVGEGRLQASQIPEILASRDRTRAGQTAPPQGLYLVSVRYGGPGFAEFAAPVSYGRGEL
jgi:tRNA pseudouridine38-40 synthase